MSEINRASLLHLADTLVHMPLSASKEDTEIRSMAWKLADLLRKRVQRKDEEIRHNLLKGVFNEHR